MVKITGNRFSVNMISAVTNRGELVFSTFKGRFVTPVFLKFLNRLIQHQRRKVFLIIDGHPVHRAIRVQQWLSQHSDEIEMFFLPGYSPERNPDELLNQDLKANIFKTKRPVSKAELDAMLRATLRSFQRQPKRIQGYFNHPLLQYAAA